MLHIPTYARILAGTNEAWEQLALSNHNEFRKKPFSNKAVKAEDLAYPDKQWFTLQTTQCIDEYSYAIELIPYI